MVQSRGPRGASDAMMHPPQDKALEDARKRGDVSPDKTCCQNSCQCEIQRSSRCNPASRQNCRLTQTSSAKFGDPSKSQENNLQIGSKFSHFGPLAVVTGLLSSCLDFNAMAQYAPRFYPGDEDTRLG